MDTAGEGEGGGIERVALKHTHYHIEIHSLWDVGASHKELNPVLCDNLGGGMGEWEGGSKGRGTLVAKSHCCMAETMQHCKVIIRQLIFF